VLEKSRGFDKSITGEATGLLVTWAKRESEKKKTGC